MPERAVITNLTILYCAVEIRKNFFCRNFIGNQLTSTLKKHPESDPESLFNEKTV
ncbi:MAG: hypothetical protein WBM35_00100 [Candidatus Electrothrix sp.]